MTNTTLIAGIVGAGSSLDSGYETTVDRTMRFALPEFSTDRIATAERDCEILRDILSRCPGELEEIVRALAEGRTKEAREAARSIGIAEESFADQGGGMLALILLCVACALLLEHD